MKQFLFRHLLLPAFESGFKRRKTLRYWSQLERSQWRSSAEIEAEQHESLRTLIAHAQAHCPYYRDEWARLGLTSEMVETRAEFSRWPIIDREIIRANRERMRAPGVRLIPKSTGGSSGEPLQFDIDLDSHERRTAAWHRGYSWAGAAPGTRQLYLWGVPLGQRPWRARAKDRAYHALQRRRIVPCFEGGAALASEFVREIERYRPDAVVAYTNPMYEVARHLDAEGRRPSFSPKAIVLGAEKVHPFQREIIERVFRAPVFETYGSREFMLIGAECERHQGLHLTAENLLVEIVDDRGQPVPNGVEGNVVITDLFNYGMPFIRYANGDRAVASTGACDCGRQLPMLEKVVGRRLDMLHASGGRLIPGEFFPHLVKDFPSVRRFQVVQEELKHVRFALEAGDMREKDRAELERLVRDAFGPEVRVEFERVERITLTQASKLQVVVNKVTHKRAS